MSAGAQSFTDNFFRLTDHSPMRWQHRLFDQFIDGKIPAALDLPTGLGKTSVMAIWLLARAALANDDKLKCIPRRLVYIVDRRAVVDQATEEAEKLRTALEDDTTGLKKRLRLDRSLPISTLRGKHVDNREWLNDPTSPAIIIGTVDMIGSRLLFGGYGVSRKMRPYHAGLLGADTLIVLDEAHLVPPFEELLEQIANGAETFGPRISRDSEIVPQFRLMSLSATGNVQSTSNGATAKEVFRLEDDDLSDLTVKTRLSAKKTLGFTKIDDDKNSLADSIAQQAWSLSEGGAKPVRCLVYCDSRDVAEKVKASLDILAEKKSADSKADTELFIGARRIKERENAKAWLKDYGFLADSASPAKPAFLIATSAGEVGIDLDADHMVCDLVPWERMVQRLGRVNRRGEGDATITVVHGDEPKPKKPDAPTDQEARQARAYLSLGVLREIPDVGGDRDASPGALRKLKLRANTDDVLAKKIRDATTPAPLHPELTRSLVDAWSMTSLDRHTGRPKVARWLRGWVKDEGQTTVIWRTHLPVRNGAVDWPLNPVEKTQIETFFEAAPPHESEKLETETYRVAEWLQQRAKKIAKPKKADREPSAKAGTADAEAGNVNPQAQAVGTQAADLARGDITAFVLSPAGDYEERFTLYDLAQERKAKAKDDFQKRLTGKIVIVDARLGGEEDGLLKPDRHTPPATADTSESWSQSAGFRVRWTGVKPGAEYEQNWYFEDSFVLRDENDDPAEWLVVEHYKSTPQSEEGRSVSGPQELAKHQSWAEQKARDIAAKLGLSSAATEALAFAALLHDEGKRAARWQRAFKASRDAKAFGLSGPLAKTRGPIDQAILDGYRHEFGSLPFAEAHPGFQALPEDWHDLVLHLIAAHHGSARPLIGTRGCEDAPPSALQERASSVALRFAALQRRWGPWGLAWWEALLRAADQQASRENDDGKAADATNREER